MPVAFLLAIAVAKLDATARAAAEIEAFHDQYVRAQTGFGAAAASDHQRHRTGSRRHGSPASRGAPLAPRPVPPARTAAPLRTGAAPLYARPP